MPPVADEAAKRRDLWRLAAVLLLVLGGSKGLSWWREAEQADQIKAGLGQQRIVLYTTQTCVYCTMAKSWLRSHDIAWDECDVERNASCKATFDAQGAPGTPLVRIGPHWHLGFEPAWIAQTLLLEQKGHQPKPSVDTSPRP